MKIVVTGATGFIGRALTAALRDAKHDVIALVRRRSSPSDVIVDSLESQGPWCDTLDGADAIVHLAGEPVAGKKWDARQKQVIRDSRVESARTIVESIARLPAERRPRVLVCASGVDYYPFAYDQTDFDDDEVTEADPPGDSFLARVCRDWEHEALEATKLGVRVACMRTGLVLGKGGGALGQLARPFKLFAGGRIGSGRQWMSWIHLDDVVAAYVAALTDERYRGPINLVTASVRNYDFARVLGGVLHRPAIVPTPAFAVRMAAGKEFSESILQGRRVMPTRLRALGFAWKHPTLDRALAASVD